MTLVVKLGSSIVAADDGELRADVLDSVCAQVAELEQGGERVVMVTSGAIARGMRLMGLPVAPAGDGRAAGRLGGRPGRPLPRLRVAARPSGGTRAAQVLLTAADIAARTNYLNARQTLRRLIEWGVVPVVNENDTTATDEITFGDNDFLAAQVAILLDARLLVLLTDVDGLYTRRPARRPGRRAGRRGRATSPSCDGLEIGDRTSAFGSGGMRSKVAAAEMASEAGIPAVICNGTTPGTLRGGRRRGRSAPASPPGPARPRASSSGSSTRSRPTGGSRSTTGAARVLRESGSSLLPVGITAVEGDFEAGDAVEVAADGAVDRQGDRQLLVRRAVARIKGMKSAEVRELMPHAAEEVDPPRPLRACV